MAERNFDSWLAEIPESKAHQRAQRIRTYEHWLNFLGDKNEDWVLANKDSEDWGQHLCDFRDYLRKQPKQRGEGFFSDNTTKTLTAVIRSYLQHIGCKLVLTRRQKTHLTKVESLVSIDFPMNIRVKEKLLSVADPIEDYIISCGISFGLRIGDFLSLTRGRLEPLIEQDIPIPIGKVQTQKVGEPAFPFIGGDAKQSIERVLEYMDKMKRTDSNEPILKTDENGVNQILQDLFKKAGIKTGNYQVRFHILRKFLTDNLASVSSGDKWKRIVGKSAKSPYIANECREAFKRVMPLIDCDGARLRGGNQKVIENLRITIKQQEHEIIGLRTRLRELQNQVNAVSEFVGFPFDKPKKKPRSIS